MKTRLPLLRDDVQLAFRCDFAWDELDGTGPVRTCNRCDRDVHDLSALTRAQAAALIAARRGNLCVRLRRRRDGSLITADAPRRWPRLAALLALLVGLAGRAHADLSVDKKTPPAPAAKTKPHAQKGSHHRPPPKPHDGDEGGILMPNF